MNERLPACASSTRKRATRNSSPMSRELADDDRLAFFKLTTGALRIGVAKGQVVQALAEATGLDGAARGATADGLHPGRAGGRRGGFRRAGRVRRRRAQPPTTAAPIRSFSPISLNLPFELLPEKLGPPEGWIAEWKFDGIRAQLLKRGAGWRLWSRGEELISDSFPDLAVLAAVLPDRVALDGEIVVARGAEDVEGIEAFALLQQRLNRKTLTDKHIAELPVAFIAYDLLEEDGVDLRAAAAARAARAARAHCCAPPARADPRRCD